MSRSIPLVILGLFAAACDVATVDGSVPSNPLPVPNVDTGGFGQGGSGGAGGGTGGEGAGVVGGSGQGACDGGGPVIETAGATDKYLLKGTLILPAGPLVGELLIDGNTIVCVGASCAGDPAAAGATVIDTHGVIAPGLLDAHNHIIFDIFDEDDWSPPQLYTNHNQWPNDDKYGAVVDAKQYLNGESGSPVDLGCELDKYGEAKALIAGTTSVQGSAGATNKACYQTLSRTIDMTYNGLPDDNMQTATVFPTTSSADGVCTNFGDGDTTAYVIHIAEGVDQTARDEFDDLNTVTTTDGCLYDAKTTIIHGAALTDAQITTMGANNMQLVWSPRSNIFLYGAGTDMTKTANIPKYIQEGINIAIAPDWSMGGSQNMLDELRYANEVDDAQFGNLLTPADIVAMGTINAARALGVDPFLGSLEVGKRADIAVFLPSDSGGDAYDAILAATPREVTLVFVDGRLLYGDGDLVSAKPADSISEEIDICCRQKFMAIAQTGGNPNDKLDQTFAVFADLLETAMVAYDNQDLTEWDFAPITPLVKCP